MTIDADSTVALEPTPTRATVALPIGLGEARPKRPEPRALVPAPPPPKKPTSISWIVAIASAAAVLTAVAFWWYNTAGPGAYAKVPVVSGLTANEASTVLIAANLDVEIVLAFDDDVDLGLVIGTDPPEGGPVSKEGTVIVTVSKGPRMTEIPSVVGIDKVDALDSLDRVGFPTPDVTLENSDTVLEGDVISVDPAEGESVRHDTVLTLVVSDGPAPITFPNILGSAEATATALLEDQYGLVVTVEYGRTDAYAEGQVYNQDPEGGETGHRTDSITIWVSEGPILVEVPYFSGMNEALARATAENVGLEVTVTDRLFTWCSAICGQSIAPGEMVEEGTVIDLWY